MDIFDRREIDDQAVIADPEAAGVVSAAANRDPQIILAAEADSGHDVGHVGAAGDQPWLSADHRVVDFAGLLVDCVSRLDQLAPELSAELGDGVWL